MTTAATSRAVPAGRARRRDMGSHASGGRGRLPGAGQGYPRSVLPDYAELESAIGLDWYALDPNLRLLLDRLLPDPEDRAFAEEHVATYGTLCGGPLAARAEITDKHGPVLVRHDRWGHEVDTIEHHPTWIESKADLVRAGFTGLSYHAGRPVPAVVTAAMSYLVSQAETAIYCGLGMTSGAADIVERYAPEPIRDDMLARLTSLDPETAWEGGMFLTERQGGSDVGANTTIADPRRRGVATPRREALLLERRRRGVHRARATRGRARGHARPRDVHRAPTAPTTVRRTGSTSSGSNRSSGPWVCPPPRSASTGREPGSPARARVRRQRATRPPPHRVASTA